MKDGHAPDGADLALDIVERDRALGRGVEFEDARHAEAIAEMLPDIGPQAIAGADAQPVPALIRVRWGCGEIAAEFADILEDGAARLGDIAPEAAGRELLADDDRAAAEQYAARRHDPADTVIERQAIIHAVVRTRVDQPGEPVRPHHDAVVADARGLGQACRAGGVDQQRLVADA